MQITLVLANHILHTFIHPLEKLKIKNFHVFDVHWLYRTSRYAVVKVDITERNNVTKHRDARQKETLVTIFYLSLTHMIDSYNPTW